MSVFTAVAANQGDIDAFREARFGMFIHWGLYAQLGGRWKGQKMDNIGEWIQSRYHISNAEYAKLAKVFNPVKFDADEWIREAKAAGVEYIVFTTKHHDGFSMYATMVSDYNIVDATPFKRDILGELVKACHRHGVKVGFYYSQNLDWHEYDAADPVRYRGTNGQTAFARGMDWGNCWDWPDASKKNLDRYLKAKVYPQLKELLTKYGDVFLLWFDVPLEMTEEQSRGIRDYVRSLSPHTLVNSRIGNGFGDFGSLGDNQMVVGGGKMAVECPITLNDTWGFKYDDHNWKTAYDVACRLMQSASCDANLLLNVGPRPDGRLPDAFLDVLAELAAWRKNTGVEFKGVKPSPFPQELPWGWCTVAKDNVLQFVVKSEWANDLEVCGIRNRIKDCTLPYEQSGDVVRVKLAPVNDAMPRVVRLRLDGAPDIDHRLVPQNGELILLPTESKRILKGEDGRCRVTDGGALTDWHHPGDSIAWKAYFQKPGDYEIWVRTETWVHSCPWEGNRKVRVTVGDRSVTADLRKDRELPYTIYARAESRIGNVRIDTAGEREVKVETCESGKGAERYNLSAVRLECRKSANVPERVLRGGRTLNWTLPKKATLRDGRYLRVTIPDGTDETVWATAKIPVSRFSYKSFRASIRYTMSDLMKPLHNWFGAKFMLIAKDKESGKDLYPSAHFGLKAVTNETATIFKSFPVELSDDGTLCLGLQGTSGAIEFDLDTLEIEMEPGVFPVGGNDRIVNYPQSVRVRPHLRGVMSPNRPTERDFADLKVWGATLMRYQMKPGFAGTKKPADNASEAEWLAYFDAWAQPCLDFFEKDMLKWGRQYGIRLVLDLHAAPGDCANGEMRMFKNPRFAERFISFWRGAARRLRGNGDIIYGYDLINEPAQTTFAAPGYDYWTIQKRAAEAVRSVDPDATIIVESNAWASPSTYSYLGALDMDNIIYEVHMYHPMEFTHQNIGSAKTGMDRRLMTVYPDLKKGWDRAALMNYLKPAADFQRRHSAKIYVGEFSAVCWADGADRYLADCISCFEELGWDWTYHAFREFQGWDVEWEGESYQTFRKATVDTPRKKVLIDGFRKVISSSSSTKRKERITE